tara:strand:- start:40885 stop:41100 length:216 start_codon:yes stop_codon:yes gene_type:complete
MTGKFVISNDKGTNSLILKIEDTGQIDWCLYKQNFFLHDGSFVPYGVEALTVYDFIYVNGTGWFIVNNYNH